MADGLFEQGSKVWVHVPGGDAVPAIYVGGGENATFFGGPPLAYIVVEGSKEPVEVNLDQITRRD
jgi:hypothetical protein